MSKIKMHPTRRGLSIRSGALLLAALIVVALVAMIGLGVWNSGVEVAETNRPAKAIPAVYHQNVAPAPRAITIKSDTRVRPHVVKKHQSLTDIARFHSPSGTSVKDLIHLNERLLALAYIAKCDGLSKEFRTREKMDFRKWRRGGGTFYCNDTKGTKKIPAWANSLLPEEIIYVPVETPSSTDVTENDARTANQAVARIPKDASVVLVIDSSGSMHEDSDRTRVARLYQDLLSAHEVRLIRFSERAVKVTSLGETLPHGALGNMKVENIFGALQLAKDFNPDVIILIGDEHGDDWPKGFLSGMPPVEAHCLDEADCGKAFRRIEELTRKS